MKAFPAANKVVRAFTVAAYEYNFRALIRSETAEKMSTKTGAPLESTPISDWLEELHMECYKKNLEDFETIKTLLDVKEIELKKLGVYNSRDRAAMLGSLANYRAVREESSLSSVSTPRSTPSTSTSSSSKSVLRKGSLKKLNLKSLLGSGSSKKAKKKPESGPLITVPSMASSLDLASELSPRSQKPGVSDYEDPDSPKPFQGVVVKAIENEYGPSPQGSPQFRHRAHTVGEFYTVPDVGRGLPSLLEEEDSPSSLLKHKHLSVISMESGLSFGYDVEKDFNPALPLENQPWYHGRIMRFEAEALLHEDGDFLVRENTTMSDTYTLSMHWRGGHDHTLIGTTEVVSNKNSMAGGTAVKYHFEVGAFDSIPELVYNHLKYQIPLNKETHNLLVNPVCRMGGNKGPIYGDYSHPPPPVLATAPTDDFSVFSTLPKNFGSRHKKQPVQPTSVSPEPLRHYPLRSAKSVSISPRHSPRNSPAREAVLKTYSSSGDLLESSSYHASPAPRHQRNAFSPPPVLESRSRASTTASHCHTLAPEPRERVPSFEDYEMMESVSIKNPSPPLTPAHLGARDAVATTSTVAATTRNTTTTTASALPRENVKYAEIKYPRADANSSSFRRSQAGSGIKYAEVRFSQSQNRNVVVQHPFSLYDTVPPPKHANPYQSRAEILAQKLQMESSPAAVAASESHHRDLSRVDSTPHPFSHYASLQSLPRQTSVPGTGIRNSMVPIAQTDTTLYSLPDKARQNRLSAKRRDSPPTTKSRDSPSAAKNRESTASNESNRASPGLAQSTKVLKSLPGYNALVKLHTLFSNHSNEDLAFHVTKADAVCFLLAPRPGEDRDVWKERIRQVSSSSGVYVGIQTLGDPDGEKLWKKLYFRHLSFSQLVSLCIVSAGEVLDRAKMLRRFIDIAYLLQSSSFGNLFSFVAVMQGIAAPQVTDMTGVWAVLHAHFPNTASTYKELQGFISGLSDDVAMYDISQLSVPAIQHLKTAFHYEEQSIPGFAPVREDRSLVGEYSSLLTGLDGVRTIVSHCSQFCYNSRRRLDKHQYDATLMDFLMQDYTRVYLQEMGVSADGQLERRRRFGVLLDALVDRVEALESTEV